MADAAAGESANDMKDLIRFLRDPNPEMRRQAAGLVQGLTGSAEGAQALSQAGAELLPALLWLVGDSSQISKAALTSLVNLSQDAGIAAKLLGISVIDKCLDYIKEHATAAPELLVMLLCNVTTTEQGSKQMLQVGRGDLEGFHMGTLLSRFIDQQPSAEDPYGHVAYILTNVTRLKQGQEIILEPGRGYINALISQLQSDSAVRRQGCSAALRNLCFGMQDAGDEAMAPITDNQQLLEAIVAPLSGKASAAADDDTTREALAEAVLILASSDKGRKALWTVNAPEVLRKGYEAEENPGVCAAMERTAELFIAGNVAPEIVEEPPSSAGSEMDQPSKQPA